MDLKKNSSISVNVLKEEPNKFLQKLRKSLRILFFILTCSACFTESKASSATTILDKRL